MSKTFHAYSDGTYVFMETEKKNVFFFYRSDGKALGEVGSLPMDFYEKYMVNRMIEEEGLYVEMEDIRWERSEDDKRITVTICGIDGDFDELQASLRESSQKVTAKGTAKSKPGLLAHLKGIFS